MFDHHIRHIRKAGLWPSELQDLFYTGGGIQDASAASAIGSVDGGSAAPGYPELSYSDASSLEGDHVTDDEIDDSE